MRRKKPGSFGKTGFLEALNRSRSRGLTLMELLVVVAVMVILLGAALPLLKIGLAGRRTREVSRQLGTYVELAKSATAETGREAGLILQVDALPENGLPYVSQLYLAETPRPYAGDMVGARATIAGNTATFNAVESAQLTSLVHPGDQIRFDYRGILYNITAISNYTITFAGSPLPPNNVTLPYQIYRQPEKSSSAPMQLSTGAVIDLSMSGFGLAEESIFDKTTISSGVISEVESVAILFGPSGEMTRVLVNRIQTDTNASPATMTPITIPIIPTGTLHLLIGGIDGVLLDDIANVNVGDDLETNIENPDNLWVSIGHQSGRATTAENGWTLGNPTSMPLARQFAQSSEAMGGR